MQECDATLFWTLSSVSPSEGARPGVGEGQRYSSLSDAVREYRAERISRRAGGYLPWLKPHGAGGAPWLNEPQIEAVARTLEPHKII